MRRNRFFCYLLAIVFVMVFFPSLVSYGYAVDNTNGGDTLIQNIINAYGGKENLSKVRTLSAVGHIKKLFPYDEGSYSRILKRERKLFVDIKYSRFEEKRILNNKKGYRGTDGKTEEVTGPPYDAMVYQYNQIDLPFGFVDGSYKMVSHHKDSLNDEDVEVLQLKDNHGYDIDVYVSSKDFLILKVIGYFQMGQEKRSLGAEFSDYKKAGEIILPHKIINYANNFKLSETDIMKYKINPQIDDDIFDP